MEMDLELILEVPACVLDNGPAPTGELHNLLLSMRRENVSLTLVTDLALYRLEFRLPSRL